MTDPIEQHPLDRLPRWLPAVTYALFTVLAFRAYLFAPAGSMLYGSDTIAAGVMLRSFFVHAVQALGHIPQWNPYLQSGLPYVEAGGGDTLYPTSILHFFLSMPQALAWKLIIHVFVAGFAMYYCARVFGVSRWVAYVAGGVHMLSAQILSQVFNGQDTKLYCAALFPLALGLLVRAIERRSFTHFVWFGLLSGLLLIGHPNLAFYAWMTFGAWGLGMIWVRRRDGARALLQRLGGGILSLGVALGIAAVILFPMYHYLRNYSPRSGAGRSFEYAANYSMHWPETVGLLVADFAGSDTGETPTYWGPNPLKGNLEFGGTLVVVLGIAAVFGLKGDRRRWALGATAFVAWLYAMGSDTPFFRLVYDLVPPIRNFRAPSLSMFLFFIPAVLLAALLLDRIARGGPEAERPRKIAGRALLIAGGVSLLIAVVVQSGGAAGVASIFGPLDAGRAAILANNLNAMILGAWIATLSCGIFWFALRGEGRGTFPVWGLLAAFLALTSLDLLRVNTPFVQAVPYASYFPVDPSMDWLKGQLGPGERALPSDFVIPQGKLATYFVPEVFGYHGNEPRWYDAVTRRDIRDAGYPGDQRTYYGYLLQLMTSGLGRLLSIRIAILPATDLKITGWTKIAGDRSFSIYRNAAALPGGAAPGRVIVEPDTASEIQALWDPSFDPADAVLTTTPIPGLGGGGAGGTFQITSESTDTVAATVTAAGPTVAILSRTWHPYWTVTVDGAPGTVLRADYAFIGVPLTTGGTHHLVFRYRSPILERSETASASTWLFVLLVSLGAGAGALRRRRAARA
jgi:hypothetical protein